jgi:hypothetical protein
LNSTKGYTITSSKAEGYSQPQPISSQDIVVIPLDVPAPDWAKVYFSFSRPIQGQPAITKLTNYIWAASEIPPDHIDDPKSSYPYVTHYLNI